MLPPHLHKQPYADDQGAEGSTWKPYTSEFKRKKSNHLQTLNYFPGAQQLPFLALDFPHDTRGETTCRHAGELFGLLQHLDVPAKAGPAAKPHRPAHKALAAAMLVAAPAGLELQGSSFLVFCPIHQTNFPWQGIKYTNYFCPRVFHPLQLQCLDNCCHYICRAGVLEKIPETPDTITL